MITEDRNAIIASPGRYQGERVALMMAYEHSLNGEGYGEFGDVDGFGFYGCCDYDGEAVFYMVDSAGFVTEISAKEYGEAEKDWEAREED